MYDERSVGRRKCRVSHLTRSPFFLCSQAQRQRWMLSRPSRLTTRLLALLAFEKKFQSSNNQSELLWWLLAGHFAIGVPRRFQVLLSSRFPTFHALYCRETCERRTALFLGFAQAHSELTHAVASFGSLNTATSRTLSRPHSTQWLLPWATKASWRGPRSWSVEMAGISSRNRSKR